MDFWGAAEGLLSVRAAENSSDCAKRQKIFLYFNFYKLCTKVGFNSEETGGFLLFQNKYSRSLSWAENLNFLPKSVNNLFKFSAQDSDLENLFWRSKSPPVSSDLKPPLEQDQFLVLEYYWFGS